ncbi:hypothetical protein M758_11G108400 [Ceratodon purpureus]|nr:hypothetical protein M758_11G108400 [Ceratodon purpureus]
MGGGGFRSELLRSNVFEVNQKQFGCSAEGARVGIDGLPGVDFQ